MMSQRLTRALNGVEDQAVMRKIVDRALEIAREMCGDGVYDRGWDDFPPTQRVRFALSCMQQAAAELGYTQAP